MNSFALTTQPLAGLGRVAPALEAETDNLPTFIASCQVHPPVGHLVTDLEPFAELGALVAVPTGGDEVFKAPASESVPPVTAVVDFSAWLFAAAFADALRSLENFFSDDLPTRAREVISVGSKAHACQEKVTLLIRGELFAHCGDSEEGTGLCCCLGRVGGHHNHRRHPGLCDHFSAIVRKVNPCNWPSYRK